MNSASDRAKAHRQQYMAMDPGERSTFDTWRQAITEYVGIGLTDSQKETRRLQTEFKRDVEDCKKCEKWRNELLVSSPLVRFMADNLKKTGFKADHTNMPCMKCDEMRSGGFSSDGVIQLCYNRLMGKYHLETTMAHEMVHAYDDANFNIDWYNLEHHACTEIRAASLSGDCTWFQELLRGNLGFLKHHQVCVKRRAVLSVLANPSCKSQKHAEAAVNKVFKSCFNDTRPFDEIY
ncbi:Mitochondrial inner membrane protease atp23 [Coemansia thaxteri]|uniref:Mitochondrial inner membrane protease ATP23 n=1 Tax=Coemansia thaxteri TaxID=2663907 RepID=A0A9W8ED26_9FUNG|nr:Mitochondrial inner membrane protease atp23 [Coemansia thaxteri]KAJ1998514.1 Mitochondrial inner membrane protease atp23 [Coemansia thaxteri]KAJ2471226.1 Mitochondrial inner membrane protease atp23 [Coemansia sp. RSA 2322]KAJ2475533.1 Mitochondrial inner membrane protease atp23 [Coemansia sp. RSA 2320]